MVEQRPDGPRGQNVCPACGPVERHTSSQYCPRHLEAIWERCRAEKKPSR